MEYKTCRKWIWGYIMEKVGFNDITVVILNWKAARMTKGAVINLQKWYPDLKNIIIGDDGSDDTHGNFTHAYGRDCYNRKNRLDMNTDILKDIHGTRFIGFDSHMGHGLTLDRILKHIKTPLMLTMDNDMRIIEPGLLEEYLIKYNEDPENIYAVGTSLIDGFLAADTTKKRIAFVNPCFTLWNMEPLRRYERLSFSNFIPFSHHYGTAFLLHWQLCYGDKIHRPRGPYKAIYYPDPGATKGGQLPQLWHLRRFSYDTPDTDRAKMWEELIDG